MRSIQACKLVLVMGRWNISLISASIASIEMQPMMGFRYQARNTCFGSGQADFNLSLHRVRGLHAPPLSTFAANDASSLRD